MNSPNEEPAAVAPLIGVAIQNELVYPALAVLDLRMAIHLASCMSGIDNVDRVRAHIQHRNSDSTKRVLERCPQCLASEGVAANTNVVDKESNQSVEIAGIDRDGVLRSQLANFFKCQQSFDSGGKFL